MTSKAFPIEVIATITTGRLMCQMENVYEIIDHVLGINVFTHMIPAVMPKVREVLFEQHPKVFEYKLHENFDAEMVPDTIENLRTTFGKELLVEPKPLVEPIDPLMSFFDIMDKQEEADA